VSTIDMTAGVVFNGFTIPALATRRMETNIELAEGQSFAIAGLIDDRVTDNIMKIPGLANIPILGALFKSKKETKTKSELLVMVTPEITTAGRDSEERRKSGDAEDFLPPVPAAKQPGSPAKPAPGRGK
jgi:pilus assembly protein CpaC